MLSEAVEALALETGEGSLEAGVLRVLELLREEIELALALVGCASPDAVTAAHVAAVRSDA